MFLLIRFYLKTFHLDVCEVEKRKINMHCTHNGKKSMLFDVIVLVGAIQVAINMYI